MKKTIGALRKYTGLKSNKALAEFFGVSKDTITRAKAGHEVKIKIPLEMLEWWFDNSLPWQHEAFKEQFKK